MVSRPIKAIDDTYRKIERENGERVALESLARLYVEKLGVESPDDSR